MLQPMTTTATRASRAVTFASATGRAQRDSVQPVWNYYVQLLEHSGALVGDPVFGIDV